MEKVLQYVIKQHQYFPTPEKLVKNIMSRIYDDLDGLQEVRVLEPCAGDGSICRVIKRSLGDRAMIDCVEIEPVLRDSLKGQGFNIVGNDFEAFESLPLYDLIIMNPPFSKGAGFLLRAYDVLAGNGRLVCLLNAETIKNPYTKERERLAALIASTGEVEYLEKPFRQSQHPTDVAVAVVFLRKPLYENEFDLFGDLKRDVLSMEEQVYEQLREQVRSTDLVSFDKVESAVNIYRTVVKTMFRSVDAIREAQNSMQYIAQEAKEFNINMDEFMDVVLKDDAVTAKENIIRDVRKIVWSYVLKLCNMDQYLFSKQEEEFYRLLDRGSSELPFTRNNILQFFKNLFEQRQEYLRKGMIDLFEEITSKHNGNPYHEEGWKTNKNWKINRKMIVDWGIEYSYDRFRVHYGQDWLSDLDKIVRRIRPYDTRAYTIKEALDGRFNNLGRVGKGTSFYNFVETPYFTVRFFKKGTLHITFKDQTILDELNQIGAGLRRDLGYDDWGKKTPAATKNNDVEMKA